MIAKPEDYKERYKMMLPPCLREGGIPLDEEVFFAELREWMLRMVMALEVEDEGSEEAG